MDNFHVKFSPGYPKDSWRIYRYAGAGTSSFIESLNSWATEQEAQDAANRINATGGLVLLAENDIKFGLCAND